MEEENNNKNNTKFWIIIILLIIIILILLFFTKFGKIQNNLIPTGNIDVFDIDIGCNCCEIDKDLPTFNEETDNNILGRVFVDDINGDYIYQQKLSIFTNAAFKYTDKIAPGVSNTYNFVVHNSTNAKLRYYIEMHEDTEYPINLKYRLRKNNSYVIGNDKTWVTANELKTAFNKIDANSSDSYSLDWNWMYEDNNDIQDTFVGENMNSTYKLKARFYFEQIEE